MTHTVKSSASQLERRRAAIERTRGVLTDLAPGRSLVDELIAERRAEDRAEDRVSKAGRRGGRS